MWPAKHLDDTSLLSVQIYRILVNRASLPDEAHWFEGDGIVGGAIVGLDLESQWAVKGAIHRVGVTSREVLIVPVVGKVGDA